MDAPAATGCHDARTESLLLLGVPLATKTVMPTERAMPLPLEAAPSRRPVILGGRFRIERPLDGAEFEATDAVRGGTVVVTRVSFGPERREERDRLVERVRSLWTVTAPALVLPVDAGAWDDDAFVVEERVEAPFTSLASGVGDLDAYERASAATNVAEGVAALHAAGFVHGALSLESIQLDGYRQPKIHAAIVAVRASPESERVEDRKLRTLLDEIAPGAVSSTREDATAAELARSIPRVDPGSSAPFIPSVEAPAPWRGMTLLAIFLTLAAFVGIGWLFSQR